ncbi:unnamed protein product [Arabis nemorensis]|uniref:TF-B3 domain-containing protein n=1 Tax=Arabis nemorensis TaxID=586526 RepID=A0A565C1N4_9BRAS|nr:unnamed protein product [Arabis nemorensis]
MEKDSILFGDEVPRRKRSDLKHRRLPSQWLKTAKSSVTSPGPSSSTGLTITRNENPNIPYWLVEAMKKYNGYDAKLVIKEKELFPSDLTKRQARLLFPPNQVVCSDYLTEEEIRTLESNPQDKHRKQGVSVVFLDSEKEKHNVELKKWKKNLVLAKGWINVINTDLFKVREKFPLWCFRSKQENGKLYFALVPKDENTTETESSSSRRSTETSITATSVKSAGNPPENWLKVLDGIRQMTSSEDAPVLDSRFCVEERRFALLLGSLLSIHPKDKVLLAIRRLHQNGLLTPEAIDKADESTITNLIYSAGIDSSKATFMKIVAKTCLVKYNGDIPNSLHDLQLAVPGIDPKMAQLILDKASTGGDSSGQGGCSPLSFDDNSELPLTDFFKGYLPTESELQGFLGIPPSDSA